MQHVFATRKWRAQRHRIDGPGGPCWLSPSTALYSEQTAKLRPRPLSFPATGRRAPHGTRAALLLVLWPLAPDLPWLHCQLDLLFSCHDGLLVEERSVTLVWTENMYTSTLCSSRTLFTCQGTVKSSNWRKFSKSNKISVDNPRPVYHGQILKNFHTWTQDNPERQEVQRG